MADGRRSRLGVGGDWERVQLRKRHVSASLIPSPCACSPWPRVVLPTTLIPVLVTGIQSREVFRVERLFRVADATLLDSCDKHRNEESWAGVATETLGGRCGGEIRTAVSAERLPPASPPKISPSTSTALRSRLARSKRCGDGAHPRYPHFCACHRNPVTRSLSRGKSPPASRTRRCWIPVTSTGMRRVARVSRRRRRASRRGRDFERMPRHPPQ